jgi:hypothetical protein
VASATDHHSLVRGALYFIHQIYKSNFTNISHFYAVEFESHLKMNMGHTVLYDGIKVPENLICMIRSVGDESVHLCWCCHFCWIRFYSMNFIHRMNQRGRG